MQLVRDLLKAAVAVKRVLIPVATKVLFRKRRELIPILDNEVIGYYACVLRKPMLIAQSQDHRPDVVAGVGLSVLTGFREDLIGVYDTVASLAGKSAGLNMPVGPVRALEILVWTEVEPRGYYRQSAT